MSLIGEALRRAREHSARQGDKAAPPAPFPLVAPPPRPARPRHLIALSIATSLGVSLLVASGLYFLLARPAAPGAATTSPSAKSGATATPQQSAAARAPAPAPLAPRAAAPPPGDAGAAASPAAATGAARVPPHQEATPTPATPLRPAPSANPFPAPTPASTAPPRPAPATGPPATQGAPAPAPGIQLPDGTRVTLDGIVWGNAPIAMLNGRLMSPGERLGSYTLARIEQRRVTLLGDDGKTYVVDLVK